MDQFAQILVNHMFKNKYPPPDDSGPATPAGSSEKSAPVSRAMAKARLKPDFTLFDLPKPQPSPSEAKDKERAAEKNPAASASAAQKPRPGRLGRVMRTLFKTVLLAVLLVWVFVLGVLVGRQSFFELPEVRRLAENIEDLTQKALNLVIEPEPAPALTGEEANKPSPPTAAAGLELAFPAAAETAAGRPSSEAISGAWSLMGSAPSPGEDAPTAEIRLGAFPKPLQALKPDSSEAAPPKAQAEFYSVRVLSTSSKSRADEMVDRLKAQGYEAYYVEASGRYQVRVGRYETFDEARTIREKLEAQGYNGPYVSKANPLF